MQTIDAYFWKLNESENLNACSNNNRLMTNVGLILITLQPISSLIS